MGDAAGTFTTDDLVALLADAGEVDAGVEVLEAIRAHDQSSPQTMRLQARLFAAEPLSPERRREALTPLRDGRVDALAREGALLEACVALRLLNREFPDEPAWAEKLSRLEDLLLPLPNLHGDPRRADVDALIALGRTREAWELLREMITDSPGELELSRRADALRALLFEPAHTRPYREADEEFRKEMAARHENPDEALDLAEKDVAAGDLRGAMRRMAHLSPSKTDATRWTRYRDALAELVAVIDAEDGLNPGSHEEETARLGMTDLVDMKIRAGALREAREDAMRQLAAHPDATDSSILTRRIAALDELLGGAPRPAAAVVAEAVTEQATPAEPSPAIGVASVEVEIVRDPPRLEHDDDDPTKRRTSLPSPDGVVEKKRRRIVHLG
ncbi:MAG: hypothetical protein Q8S73_21255 [Deltaproteobacteria bacterium]|nr:hypothetical protein [Myxococcales bacterium]MDP3216652.1 hypothetical protein [Deltaproteobacteria bacterium]